MASLQKVLELLNLRRTRVVMDFPLFATMMRHLQLPKVGGAYLEPMVISEVVESIPFSKEEVDVAWHVRKHGGALNVFAIAVPKDRQDGQVKLMRAAGMTPMAGYAKGEALSFAAGAPDAIVVNLESSHASVVLVLGHMPQVVHQVDFSQDERGAQARLEVLARAVDQVTSYSQTIGFREDAGAWPLVLTGEVTDALSAALPKLCQRPTVDFAPEINFPKNFQPALYSINLGLFLAYQSRQKDQEHAIHGRRVSLNLLAQRHMPLTVPVAPVAVFITLLLLWLHPYDVTAHVKTQVADTANLATNVGNLRKLVFTLRADLAQEKAIQAQIVGLQGESKLLHQRLDDLDGQMDTLLDRMQAITHTARPEHLVLQSVSQRADGFIVVGTASNYTTVLDYANNLRQSGLFTSSRVVRIEGKEDLMDPANSFVSFQVETKVPMTSDAPSLRKK